MEEHLNTLKVSFLFSGASMIVVGIISIIYGTLVETHDPKYFGSALLIIGVVSLIVIKFFWDFLMNGPKEKRRSYS